MTEEAAVRGNMYVKVVSIDMCGLLLMDVCGWMLGVGMTGKQKNADACDMGKENRIDGAVGGAWYT